MSPTAVILIVLVSMLIASLVCKALGMLDVPADAFMIDRSQWWNRP